MKVAEQYAVTTQESHHYRRGLLLSKKNDFFYGQPAVRCTAQPD